MKSPQGYILYRIWYGQCLAYVGRTKQPLQARIRGHIVPDSVGEKSILCTVDKDGVLTPYDDTYDVVIHCSNKEDQEQTVKLIKDSNWIPVSERLPEMPEENPILDNKPLEIYIVDIGEHYPFRAFWNGKNFTDGWNILKVIAWKPLPEPYKEEEYE